MVLASVAWPTTAQWVFWHLVHADGVPIEWFLTTIPKLDAAKHDEAISNIILMMKRMGLRDNSVHKFLFKSV